MEDDHRITITVVDQSAVTATEGTINSVKEILQANRRIAIREVASQFHGNRWQTSS